MKVLDPGHYYELDSLDGCFVNALVFVKRQGAKYPGNIGAHSGTTSQEVLRALIDRAEYVNAQTPCAETQLACDLMRTALWLLESRAARRHGRPFTVSADEVVSGAGKCRLCGHVGCPGSCRQYVGG